MSTETKSPLEQQAYKKRQANRLHKLRTLAKSAGVKFTMRANCPALETYCSASFGVSVAEYCSDEYAESATRGRSSANIEELATQISLNVVDMSSPAIMGKTYKPWKTKTEFDLVASRHGGIYPGSTIILTGESGAGKTTLALQVAAKAQANNKDCNALFISGEMSIIDWQEECDKFPTLRSVPVIYMRQLNKYTGDQYLAAIRKALMSANLIVVDSLAVIADRIKDATNMSANEATFWLIDQMNDIAESNLSTFIAIQHFTKGGSYVGSTRLKHDTTAMVYCTIGEGNKTCFVFNKNRRGDRKYLNKPMYFSVPVGGEIEFDGEKFDELMLEAEIKEKSEIKTITKKDLAQKIQSISELQAELIESGAYEEDEDNEDY